VSTKSISTSIAHSSCDVCGRTLLRGERAEVYVSGGARQTVCDLCTPRALHGGWVREGDVPDYEERGARVDRRRSLLSRLRGWRDQLAPADEGSAGPEEDWHEPPPPEYAGRNGGRQPAPVREPRGSREPRSGRESRGAREPSSRRDPRAAREPRSGREPRAAREPRGVREPRHVRAVPTSIEHRISSAVDLFNASEHPRTVAGIGRSLGLPEVSVLPATGATSAVWVVIAWELCWYRYEVDLSDEVPSVRVSGQGYELDELGPEERQPNAIADDRGMLSLAD
jgi:hypothetical protein